MISPRIEARADDVLDLFVVRRRGERTGQERPERGELHRRGRRMIAEDAGRHQRGQRQANGPGLGRTCTNARFRVCVEHVRSGTVDGNLEFDTTHRLVEVWCFEPELAPGRGRHRSEAHALLSIAARERRHRQPADPLARLLHHDPTLDDSHRRNLTVRPRDLNGGGGDDRAFSAPHNEPAPRAIHCIVIWVEATVTSRPFTMPTIFSVYFLPLLRPSSSLIVMSPSMTCPLGSTPVRV
jgi:hypothetical protein